MKGLLLLSVILIGPPIRMGGTAASVDPNGLDLLLDAIAAVESRNDPGAAGDGGRALGPYQIHRAYWADAARFLGVDWSYTDAQDPVKAREVVRAYLLHYGRGCSTLEMARIHNGGPNGHKKTTTLAYAHRIAATLRDTTATRQQRARAGS